MFPENDIMTNIPWDTDLNFYHVGLHLKILSCGKHVYGNLVDVYSFSGPPTGNG